MVDHLVFELVERLAAESDSEQVGSSAGEMVERMAEMMANRKVGHWVEEKEILQVVKTVAKMVDLTGLRAERLRAN